MKKIVSLLLLLKFVSFSYGQSDLFIPIEFQNAIEKGTRSLDGQPGINYWQNKAEYNIRVKVEPDSKRVLGEEVISYHNNSPDTLDEIVIRLYQDIYKINARRNLKVSAGDLHNGTLISKLVINKQSYCLDSIKEVLRNGTNLIVTLKSRIYPKSRSSIEINWEYYLPSQGLREGAIGDSAFFIGYWYPQISVYDDLYGWDKYNYFGIPEFYNDFNDYDITIDAPSGYFVWATGELINPDKIYSKYISDKINLSEKSDSITHIIANEDLTKQLLIGNIWNFKADQVPDFAFGLSNYYLWDETSLLLDSVSNRKLIISTAYPAESDDFKDVIVHSTNAIDFFSEIEPGIIFPYNKMTTFNGWNYFDFNGGMEYPMIANNYNHKGLLKPYITSHEIAHNYFPFYTGTNERLCTWMDEGLANMYHYKYLISIYPKLNPSWLIDEFETYSGTISDFPIFTTSMSLMDDDLYFIHTTKPHIAFLMLERAIGKDKFKTAIQEFVCRWHGKHPSGIDFILTFNESTGDDLNWFWKPWFFEFGYPDLSIEKIHDGTILIGKKGNLPVPIELEIKYQDGTLETISKSVNIWSSGINECILHYDKSKKIREAILNAKEKLIPDKFRKDNSYHIENSN